MEEKTKDIAIVSLEEWGQFIDQLLEEQTDIVANITASASNPLLADMLGSIAALVFGKVTSAISEKLFPDAKLIKNEKGELKWK